MAFIRVRLAGPSRAGRLALVLVSGALGLWGVPAARAQCPSSFAAAAHYAAGTQLYSVAISDLNGDGRLDLAVANFLSNNVSVLLGNGNGTFAPQVNYAAGAAPQSVAIGDLNGDGRLDLTVVNGNSPSASVSVLLGNGNGTFAPQVVYPVGVQPRSVAIGDLNADGRPDLAVANYNSNTVSVLLGNGDGTFAAPVSFTEGDRPSGIAAGDLNGDGRPDLVVANYWGNNVSVLLNAGPSIGFGQQPQSQSLVVGAPAMFSAAATGTGPFTYQWRRNGVPIPGATASTLTINAVTAARVGSYDVQVRGGCNTGAVATSRPAVLTLIGCNPADIATVGSPDPFSGPDGFLTGEDFDAFIILFFQGC